MLFLLAGCSFGAQNITVPSSNLQLTEIAAQIGTLRADLSRVAPTLTAFAQLAPLSNPGLPVSTPQPESPEITATPLTGLSSQQATLAAARATSGANLPLINPTRSGLTILTPTATSIYLPTPTQPIVQLSSPTPVSFVRDASLSIPAPTMVASPGEVLLLDDFSGQRGWFVELNSRYELVFTQGGYRILALTKNNPIWSARDFDYDDVRLEVDAVQLAGPTDGYYGLVCHHQDNENYYLLVVSMDGNFGIGKVKDNELRFLNFTSEYNELLSSRGNRLRADCVGDTLKLYVDGTHVLEARDAEFVSGGIGMVVGNRSTSGTDVLFDNFIALKP
jgi:hypothetical protein